MSGSRPIASSPETVLILGGYGGFGSRAARLLSTHTSFRTLVAGRQLAKAQSHCQTYGGFPLELDRSSLTADDLRHHDVDILIDATGPYTLEAENPYRLVRVCLEAGCHYVDLSDNADFTDGISQFDEEARERGVLVSSGASTIPSISAAVVAEIAKDLTRIETIESAILPGNRGPRGRSLFASIFAQAGAPVTILQDGKLSTATGWSQHKCVPVDINSTRYLKPRWGALVDAPDYKLFGPLFGAENVIVRAGLELWIFQFGLAFLAGLRRMKILPSLRPFLHLAHQIATWLQPLGSDEGGMRVDVSGEQPDGTLTTRSWLLHAAQDEGPFIPAISSMIICNKLADGQLLAGAHPCTGLFSLDELARALALIDTETKVEDVTRPPLFQHSLGDKWSELPASIRALHSIAARRTFEGEARVKRGKSRMASLICATFGFPQSTNKINLAVTIERQAHREVWHRRFGRGHLNSMLKPLKAGSSQITERFGFFTFQIDLDASRTGLSYPVSRGWFLGIPLPAFLLPRSETHETEDSNGTFHFDINLSMPVIGEIVSYKGWLAPVSQSSPIFDPKPGDPLG